MIGREWAKVGAARPLAEEVHFHDHLHRLRRSVAGRRLFCLVIPGGRFPPLWPALQRFCVQASQLRTWSIVRAQFTATAFRFSLCVFHAKLDSDSTANWTIGSRCVARGITVPPSVNVRRTTWQMSGYPCARLLKFDACTTKVAEVTAKSLGWSIPRRRRLAKFFGGRSELAPPTCCRGKGGNQFQSTKKRRVYGSPNGDSKGTLQQSLSSNPQHFFAVLQIA
jgi:hypothetical protein